MSAKPKRTSSLITTSWAISVRSFLAWIASVSASFNLPLLTSLEAVNFALCGLYPARIAACSTLMTGCPT